MTIFGLFLNDRPRTGGHKRYLELLRGLAGRGHKVTLGVAREATAATAFGDLAGAGVRLVPIDLSPGMLSVAARISASRRWARAVSGWSTTATRSEAAADPAAGGGVATGGDTSVVVVFGEGHVPAARELSRHAGAPLVVALRSSMRAELRAFGAHRGPRLLSAILRPLEAAIVRSRERVIARSAKCVIFQTARDRDEFTEHHPQAAARTAVIPNSIDASWFDPAFREANSSDHLSRLLYVGRLNRRKGVDLLLDAVSRLVDDCPELTVDIVGSGPEEAALRRRAARLGLTGTSRGRMPRSSRALVSFLGHDPAPMARIASADLLVLPSRYDSFPNVLLEALHTGTPAVATDAGGAREILDFEELLVPPDDPRALAEVIRRLAESPEAYGRAKEHVRRRRSAFEFDWVSRFERVLESVGS